MDKERRENNVVILLEGFEMRVAFTVSVPFLISLRSLSSARKSSGSPRAFAEVLAVGRWEVGSFSLSFCTFRSLSFHGTSHSQKGKGAARDLSVCWRD